MSSKMSRKIYKKEEIHSPNEGEFIDKKKKRKRFRKDLFRRSEERDKAHEVNSKFIIEETLPLTPSEKSSDEEIGEEIQCLGAQTALIIPISYESLHSPEILKELLCRKLKIEEGMEVPFWVSISDLPTEINDLSPQFKQFVGTTPLQKTWTSNRLRLNPEILKILFSKTRLVAIQNAIDEVEYVAHIKGVEICLYPLGIAMLIFLINWLPQAGELSLCDMRSMLFIAKHMNIVGDVTGGWRLSNEASSTPFYRAGDQLSPELYHARYSGDSISLKNICGWFFQLPHAKIPISKLNVIRNAFHHSVVVIDRELANDKLMEYLFHMRRAFGQTNRPPINSASTLGKVLVWRRNRYLGISREGVISISWPLSGEFSISSHEYEVKIWPKKVVGIYLILALHAHGEKMVFLALSDLAVTQAEYLQDVLNQSSLQPIKEARDQLRNLATMLARYTLGMSSGDCGGTSEYSEFFVTLRKEFGISELRNELCEELKDILAVVESNYLEEERGQRDKEELQRREKYEREKLLAQQREKKLRKFEFIGSMAGALTLPFVIVSGIFGMNLADMPTPTFRDLMLWTGFSAILFLILMVFINLYRPGKMSSRRRRLDDMFYEERIN